MASKTLFRPAMRPLAIFLCATAAGCAFYETAPPASVGYGPNYGAVAYPDSAPQAAVSVYVEPPLMQPPPIMVDWAPPPMLVEYPPPMPFYDAIWIGGYWAWAGTWVWAAGRWVAPPMPHYTWVNPYYEHRGGQVVFITGFWSPPGRRFEPPPLNVRIPIAPASPGVRPGPRPIGPPGVFVPPPPGSRPGVIVPAPVGTAPAVVVGAPPVNQPGMRVNPQPEGAHPGRPPRVQIVAPPGTTVNGRPFEGTAPNQPHLAAAQPAVVRTVAPVPSTAQPLPAYAPGQGPTRLPPPQPVREITSPAPASAPPPAPTPAPVISPPSSGRPAAPFPGPAAMPVPQQQPLAPAPQSRQPAPVSRSEPSLSSQPAPRQRIPVTEPESPGSRVSVPNGQQPRNQRPDAASDARTVKPAVPSSQPPRDGGIRTEPGKQPDNRMGPKKDTPQSSDPRKTPPPENDSGNDPRRGQKKAGD